MAIDFPNSPTNGQLFTSGNKTWQYVAADSRWDLTGGLVGPTGATGPTGPTGPTGTTGTTGPGYTNIPLSGSLKVSAYTLQTSDVGKHVQVGSGGSIVIPGSGFANGDVITVVNMTSGTVSIGGAGNGYIAGLAATSSGGTILARGIVTVMFVDDGGTFLLTGTVA